MKKTKEIRNILIGLLLGDGTISSNNVFKLSHSEKLLEYLQWKIDLLNKCGFKNNGLKEYVSTCGYNTGKRVYYTQLKVTPFIKVLRRVFYKPKKIIGNRKLLNRLGAIGVAIWYMDDGCINFRKTGDKIHGFYIRISTCLPEKELQIIIDYFAEVWDVHFYKISEGKGTYSLCCGATEGIKFINIVKPYVEQVPSMMYKITYNLSHRTNNCSSKQIAETGDTQ